MSICDVGDNLGTPDDRRPNRYADRKHVRRTLTCCGVTVEEHVFAEWDGKGTRKLVWIRADPGKPAGSALENYWIRLPDGSLVHNPMIHWDYTLSEREQKTSMSGFDMELTMLDVGRRKVREEFEQYWGLVERRPTYQEEKQRRYADMYGGPSFRVDMKNGANLLRRLADVMEGNTPFPAPAANDGALAECVLVARRLLGEVGALGYLDRAYEYYRTTFPQLSPEVAEAVKGLELTTLRWEADAHPDKPLVVNLSSSPATADLPAASPDHVEMVKDQVAKVCESLGVPERVLLNPDDEPTQADRKKAERSKVLEEARRRYSAGLREWERKYEQLPMVSVPVYSPSNIPAAKTPDRYAQPATLTKDQWLRLPDYILHVGGVSFVPVDLLGEVSVRDSGEGVVLVEFPDGDVFEFSGKVVAGVIERREGTMIVHRQEGYRATDELLVVNTNVPYNAQASPTLTTTTAKPPTALDSPLLGERFLGCTEVTYMTDEEKQLVRVAVDGETANMRVIALTAIVGRVKSNRPSPPSLTLELLHAAIYGATDSKQWDGSKTYRRGIIAAALEANHITDLSPWW